MMASVIFSLGATAPSLPRTFEETTSGVANGETIAAPATDKKERRVSIGLFVEGVIKCLYDTRLEIKNQAWFRAVIVRCGSETGRKCRL
jgi:hypothetical protein